MRANTLKPRFLNLMQMKKTDCKDAIDQAVSTNIYAVK
jgi:hypothetical protein